MTGWLWALSSPRLEVAASTLSHHVKALLIVGLISQERQATTLICRANDAMMTVAGGM